MSLRKNAIYKLKKGFSRTAYSLTFEQGKRNYYITSQFSYTQVVWIFQKQKLSRLISYIHEKA